MTNGSYEFGPFRLEPTERLLRREGQSISLKPKVFDLLLKLVTNVGHILLKEELMEQVWPDSIVEEHNLTVSISLLRIALGDNHRYPAYIETVAKRGYRFVAPVKLISDKNLESHNWLSDTASDLLNEPMSEMHSLAVLPFKNISAHARNQYLGFGLADALITRLSTLNQITVRPTSAVLKFAGKAPVSAGRQLKVETILDGSIQKWGKQIRVTAQQIRVRDGMILWAAKFDEQFTNLFAVEDSISEQVARALSAGLAEVQTRQLKQGHTKQVAAYHAYLKGRYFFNKRSADGFEKSIKYFNQAIEIDPHYALAYAGLAASYNLLAIYTLCPPREALRKAKAAALQALKLDSGLAEAHTIIGHIKMRSEWDWSGAEEELQRAIELNRNCASAHQIYSLYLRTTGRVEESMIEIKRAQELDPLSLSINASMGAALYLARRYDEAIEQLKSIIEMDNNFPTAHYLLGLSYDQQGMSDQAIAEHKRTIELLGNHAEPRASLGYALARAGRSKEARKVLKWLAETARHRHVSPYQSALIHTALGNVDDAFIFLERGFEEQDEELSLLKMDPMLDNLRDDRRFAILLQRIGLSP